MGPVEPDSKSPERVTIFISSPGDVIPERIRLEQAIDRLRTEFGAHLELEPLRWEELPLSATEHFQSQIPRPSSTDIVVVIFWWRLGTPLRGRASWPHEWNGPLTGGEVTGTEWEFEEAVHGARQNDGKPVVLVYQKLGIPSFTSEKQIEAYRGEKDRVNAFIERWFKDGETETYTNAWRDFSDEAAFADMVDKHLRDLLRERIESSDGLEVRWAHSPFRGLAAYDVGDQRIFFGRTRAQLRLRGLAEKRAADGSPWVLVTGASGSGKSSLVRAGFLPDVLKPGLVAGIGETRYVIVRPSDAAGDPLSAFAEGLLGSHGLPELADSPLMYDEEQIRDLLRAGGVAPLHPITQALAVVDSGLSEHYRPLLVVVVDQLEEVFRLPEERQEELVGALERLASGPDVWIVATIRTDFLQQLDRHPLRSRFDPDGRFLLGAPTHSELGQIITRPAHIAGLSWEDDDQGTLDEELQKAAGRDPAALPLLGYVLEQLWHRRNADGTLTFEAYRELGRLEGAIGGRAEEIFQTLPADVQAALPRVLARLVTVGQGEDARPVAESTLLDRFVDGSTDRALVDALLAADARLLIASSDSVRVAHEAVLTHWKRAAEQLETDRRDLQLIAHLRAQTQRWLGLADKDERTSLLITPGLPLTEAENLLARRPDELDDELVDLIEASVEFHDAAQQVELAKEQALREAAEWRQLQAQKLERRANAEEYYARAMQTRDRAEQVEAEDWRHDAAEYAQLLLSRADELDEAADAALREAYDLHRSLAEHPGGAHVVRGALRGAVDGDGSGLVFSLEVLPAKFGTCFLIHYGTQDARRLAIVDGGDKRTWDQVLAPALLELLDRRGVERLPIELVLVSQYDLDSVGGIVSMFEDLAEGQSRAIAVERLWFNNFQGILPTDAADPGSRKSFKWALREAAEKLGIPVNSPFDRFVMPADIGPAQVTLPGGLDVTVIAPPNDQVVDWYRRWIDEQESQGVLSGDDVRQLEGAVTEFASSPELTLVRRPPAPYDPPGGAGTDRSPVNMSSVVVHVSFGGRTMLLTSDSRPDFIMRGLFDAWLLDPDLGLHVDLMSIPHSGSSRNVTPEFLAQVRADHYVVVGARRFRLPDLVTIEMLVAARGDAAALYLGGEFDDRQANELKALFDDATLRSATFPAHERASMMIDLLDPVEPTLP